MNNKPFCVENAQSSTLRSLIYANKLGSSKKNLAGKYFTRFTK